MIGSGLLLGDGVITPAISVVNLTLFPFLPSSTSASHHYIQLSAVEGLQIVSPALSPAILPITVIILYVWGERGGWKERGETGRDG